jgi:hypothetical protein
MKFSKFYILIIPLIISCGTSIDEEYLGTYIGTSPENEMIINGKSFGMIPECKYTIQIMNDNKIRLQENCVDDIPENVKGEFEVVSSTESSCTIDYKTGKISTGTIILNKNGTGKQITYDPQVDLIKQ